MHRYGTFLLFSNRTPSKRPKSRSQWLVQLTSRRFGLRRRRLRSVASSNDRADLPCCFVGLNLAWGEENGPGSRSWFQPWFTDDWPANPQRD